MKNGWDSYWGKDSNRGYWLEPDAAIIDLVEKLDKSKTRDVLDLGCGVGRYAILLAEAGYDVTAVDSSSEALSVLDQLVSEREIQVRTIKGNYSDDLFPEESFDLVLAYNVLYHGYRETFKEAVGRVYGWLRPGGLFFFTCPTRRDDRYGNGEKAAPHTYKPLNSIHPGDIHYFADESDISDFLQDFRDVSKTTREHYWDNNGVKQFSSYVQVLAGK